MIHFNWVYFWWLTVLLCGFCISFHTVINIPVSPARQMNIRQSVEWKLYFQPVVAVTMECEEHEQVSVTPEDEGREKLKPPQIQRSVAFDLSSSEDKTESAAPARRVTIRWVLHLLRRVIYLIISYFAAMWLSIKWTVISWKVRMWRRFLRRPLTKTVQALRKK